MPIISIIEIEKKKNHYLSQNLVFYQICNFICAHSLISISFDQLSLNWVKISTMVKLKTDLIWGYLGQEHGKDESDTCQ